MSKRVEVRITCPRCNHRFDYTLYRSIWGEHPENRKLVMSDEINVATCPSCGTSTKLHYPFFYTHSAEPFFAVWWEPEHDPQIDSESKEYTRTLGEGNYLATAPRIKDWNDFKKTILKYERGELKAKEGVPSEELRSQMQGFLKHIQGKKPKETEKWLSRCINRFVTYYQFDDLCCFYKYPLKN